MHLWLLLLLLTMCLAHWILPRQRQQHQQGKQALSLQLLLQPLPPPPRLLLPALGPVAVVQQAAALLS